MKVELEKYSKRAKIVLIPENEEEKKKNVQFKKLTGLKGPEQEIHVDISVADMETRESKTQSFRSW